jgi:hypothetical protein
MMGERRVRFNARRKRKAWRKMSEDERTGTAAEQTGPARPLSPAARRALAEAEARRAEYRKKEAAVAREIGGRGGLEPGRYGDWEVKGMATDF